MVALEKSSLYLSMARRNWEEAGVLDRVEGRLGDAAASLQGMLEEDPLQTFDFAFLDADKRRNTKYLDLSLQLIQPGGVVVVDNTLYQVGRFSGIFRCPTCLDLSLIFYPCFQGKVLDSVANNEKTTVYISEFNRDVLLREDVEVIMLGVGDGVTLLRKI